jgi:multimeric flavodoxin WrbA
MELKGLILNCTLKRMSEVSNTQALINKAVALFEKEGVKTEVIRFVEWDVKPGTSSDEGDGDEWPKILEKIKACDIFIIGTPVWVGRLASTAQRVIERLDAVFHEEQLWDKKTGQFFTYNKVAGCLITGNEDGAHECAAHVLWAMHEFGFTIPPNVNSYWVGPAGPGPSYIEAGGERYLYTNKTLRYTVYNLIYFAKLLKENPIPTSLKKLAEEAAKESDKEKD